MEKMPRKYFLLVFSHLQLPDCVCFFLSLPQLCMLCSVGYHLFCCHRSEKTSRRWMALDYAGVSIGILGCYVPGVFYTFYCNNVKRSLTFAHSDLQLFSCLTKLSLASFFLLFHL